MMENRRNSSETRDRILSVNFLGRKADDVEPKIALFSIEPKSGKITKVESIEGNKISLSELSRNLKEGTSFGFGPDIEESQVKKEMLVTFKPKEKFSEWSNVGVIEINPKWRDWIFPVVCVHGEVHRCFPYFLPVAALGKIMTSKAAATSSMALSASMKATEASSVSAEAASSVSIAPRFPEFPTICAPICNAVVEIYEKTCCCIISPYDIDDLLDRLRKILERFPPIPIDPWGPIGPPPPPPPELIIPLPRPGPGPDPAPLRQLVKAVKLARATDTKIPVGNPSERLLTDLQVLSEMQTSELKLQYIDEHYYLYPIFCSCSIRKVGETPVNENGEFSFCYFKGFTRRGCRTTYYYKVRQWQENQWVYVYDGSSIHEYFRSSDNADLRTWKGRACQPDGGINPGGDFVLLENIGYIPSWQLQSPSQDSEFSVVSANAGDGLVNHNYTGQPWGKTLSFRLKFSEGLKALGAKYYRVSVVNANSSGDPDGGATPQPLSDAVVWRRWVSVGGSIQTEAVSLGPNVAPNGTSGLFLIPYQADGDWLWFQYHQSWNTTVHDNGKYLIIVEIFDASGNRLKPNGAPGPDAAKPFTFRRWIDEVNTVAVNFAALTHLFHVDNIACYADIVDLRKNGVPSTEECQFIVGCGNDNFSVGFYAFHEKSFMSSYNLWYHRGLNGPNVTLETGTTNAPPGIPPIPSPLNSANAKQSNSKTFDQMLETHDKCSFSIELRAYPKHTNGFGIIWEYGGSDNAAVALEKTTCISPAELVKMIEPLKQTELTRPRIAVGGSV